jgi:hypothetical protein
MLLSILMSSVMCLHSTMQEEDILEHDPTSMVRFLKKSSYVPFGPLTRCKPNVDQED